MFYANNDVRSGKILFGADYPRELPIIEFDEMIQHQCIEGTKYQLNVECWNRHNQSILALLLEVHEEIRDAAHQNNFDNTRVFDPQVDAQHRPVQYVKRDSKKSSKVKTH